MTSLKEGNKAFREKKYDIALRAYRSALLAVRSRTIALIRDVVHYS